jgi:adenylate cyclase
VDESGKAKAYAKQRLSSLLVIPKLLNTTELIQLSNNRIRKIAAERRSIEVTVGRVEPEIENMKLGEAKKFRLAVLHIDINDFKKTIQGLTSDKYLALVSSFLTEMTQIVNDMNGIIDRYVGDQVTALFGIDFNVSNGPQKCLDCALNMQTVIKYSLNPFLRSNGLPAISCSIGMDFGRTWVAKVGIRGNNQLTLVGETVNIAAQLVEIAGHGHIFLGEELYNGINETDKEYCKPYTSPDWHWVHLPNRTPYRFFRFTAYWTNYPLGD